jgi:hypothetical protein
MSAQRTPVGITRKAFYKRDADTLAGQYGDGVTIYVSPPGAAWFEHRGSTTLLGQVIPPSPSPSRPLTRRIFWALPRRVPRRSASPPRRWPRL